MCNENLDLQTNFRYANVITIFEFTKLFNEKCKFGFTIVI